jgi:transketolase
MRNAFADEIARLATIDSRVVLLSGDIGNKLFDSFKEVGEGRFLNCGVAEACMMSTAAGLALSGFRPVVYTITPFTTTRCFEQVRVGVCYHEAPVMIVGTGSGLSYASLGPTHHSLEDLAIMRTLPGMTVLAPCDSEELTALLRQGLQQNGPVYMRIGKKGEPTIPAVEPAIHLGRGRIIRRGSDVCLIATGTIMSEALAAAELLAKEGLSCQLMSCHTVKPLDVTMLEEVFHAFPLVGVVEEHGRIGGLGGAIAEWRCGRKEELAPMVTFGAADTFLHEIGSQAYARGRYGLTAVVIAATLRGRLYDRLREGGPAADAVRD